MTETINISDDPYLFDIESLIDFLFPSNLQHPLAAGRLYTFGFYGPLIEGKIRSGAKGNHCLADYELNEMCLQFEREDIVQIYLHRPQDMGLLSTAEQEMIISQADAHLKREKGKAMLPKIRKEDIYSLFQDLPRSIDGKVSFHEAQKKITEFRRNRIKEFKLVYPSINVKVAKGNSKSAHDNEFKSSSESAVLDGKSMSQESPTTLKQQHQRTVSESIAPKTMFLKMKGNTNADLIEQTTRYLNKHAYKINGIDENKSSSASQLISNVKLLREVPPKIENPYQTLNNRKMYQLKSTGMNITIGASIRPEWNDVCTMTGTSVGSKVDCAASRSTWKNKVTSY